MSADSDTDDDILAGALATGVTCVEAAKLVGIHERTVRRKLKEPAFRARVDELRGEIVSGAVGMLAHRMAAATRKLCRLLKSKDERVQLAAAKEIIGFALKGRADVDIASQVTELLARLDVLTKGKKG